MIELEAEIINTTRDILENAANYSLRAVELANTLRARCGTQVSSKVRSGQSSLRSSFVGRPSVRRFHILETILYPCRPPHFYTLTLQALLMVRNKCGGLLVSNTILLLATHGSGARSPILTLLHNAVLRLT